MNLPIATLLLIVEPFINKERWPLVVKWREWSNEHVHMSAHPSESGWGAGTERSTPACLGAYDTNRGLPSLISCYSLCPSQQTWPSPPASCRWEKRQSTMDLRQRDAGCDMQDGERVWLPSLVTNSNPRPIVDKNGASQLTLDNVRNTSLQWGALTLRLKRGSSLAHSVRHTCMAMCFLVVLPLRWRCDDINA